VSLRTGGALADSLGPNHELDADLPATVADVLGTVALPEARARLFAGERLIPTVWRAGRRLDAGDIVRAGDVLDLVVAVGGG
jgi:hypothetical protein